jgi:hypothetical protein
MQNDDKAASRRQYHVPPRQRGCAVDVLSVKEIIERRRHQGAGHAGTCAA